VDFPFAIVDGKLQPSEPAFSKWEENYPLHLVKKYRSNLVKLRGLRFDTGYTDEYTHIPPTCRALSVRLTLLGIEHIFEEYNGDHRNRLWGRFGRLYTQLLPYFWRLLEK
jgi:S-formylglutathione hydrolase FrmB